MYSLLEVSKKFMEENNKNSIDESTNIFDKNMRGKVVKNINSDAYRKSVAAGVAQDEINDKKIAKIQPEWEKIAKEKLEMEYIKGTFYAYGSELACLRLFYHYNLAKRNDKTDCKYSTNLKTWYFRLETNL